MSARKKAPRKRPLADYLKGEPPVDEAERTLLRALQRAADLEFALRETQGALRKVIHHTTTEAPNDAYRLGMVQAAAEEGLLRADNALGTVPPRRRATDKPLATHPFHPGDFACGGAIRPVRGFKIELNPAAADLLRKERRHA